MKKITSFLLVAVLALSMASCTKWQAQHQIRALESLTERVEKKGDSFTKQDWTEVSQEYDEICAKMNQYEYTDEQMQEIGRLKGRYYAAYAKQMLNSAGSIFNGLMNQVGGAVDGFMNSMSTQQEEQPEEDPGSGEQVDELLLGLESIFE